MTGSSVFDYIHQADHSELAEQLGLGLTQGQGMASPSPSSAGSEEGSSNVGTANPDGEFSSLQTTWLHSTAFHMISHTLTLSVLFFVFLLHRHAV